MSSDYRIDVFKNSKCTARNLEGLFVPYDSRDYCRRPCTTDMQNCPNSTRAELSVPICSLVSVALSGLSVASVAAPVVAEVVAVAVAVAAVWEAGQQYYAPTLCLDQKHNLPLESDFKSN